MENGPFDEPLQWQLEYAPNYILIATEAAMRFRPVKAGELDYVAEEVKFALEAYRAVAGKDSVILPVIPCGVRPPSAGDSNYSQEIRAISKMHGVK